MLASLAPARRRLVLAVLVLVIAALAVGVSIAVFSGGSKSRAAAVQAVPGPVLLVPGYGGSVASLQSLATALRDAGKQVLIVSLPDNAEGDLQAQASTLAAAVKAALTSSGAASVDVVGYSAGGVVARLWAREDGGAALARRIVTLGSPQHGTELATLGSLVPGACPLACQQLATGSPLLAQLNAGDETPAGPAWVSVWTTSDDVVLPPDSARLTGALDLTVQSFCRTDTVSHTGLPADKVVQRIVIAVLGTALDTPPVGC